MFLLIYYLYLGKQYENDFFGSINILGFIVWVVMFVLFFLVFYYMICFIYVLKFVVVMIIVNMGY